jgi:LemA protein
MNSMGFQFIFISIFIITFGINLLGLKGGFILILTYIIICGILAIIVVYNRIKKEQINISEARSNVGVYLQQRYEEISAMYKIVKDYKGHEVETLKEIVELRQRVSSDQLSFKKKVDIHNRVETELPKLMANFESYPQLRSNENFLNLQASISSNEANIASSRKA